MSHGFDSWWNSPSHYSDDWRAFPYHSCCTNTPYQQVNTVVPCSKAFSAKSWLSLLSTLLEENSAEFGSQEEHRCSVWSHSERKTSSPSTQTDIKTNAIEKGGVIWMIRIRWTHRDRTIRTTTQYSAQRYRKNTEHTLEGFHREKGIDHVLARMKYPQTT